MQTKDELNLQRYFDMQEHPEKYTDEELEAMMDELDRLPGVEEAWQEVMERENGIAKSEKWTIARIRQQLVGKVAAIFIGILFLSGIAYAAIHIGRQWTIAHSQQSTVTPPTPLSISTMCRSTACLRLFQPIIGRRFCSVTRHHAT